tara:strand:+ start:537 stop:1190 length:654 start_codon:yes stop_codon:yes gene_type:complete
MSTQLFKITFYSLIIQLLLLSLSVYRGESYVFRHTFHNEGRNLKDVVDDTLIKMPCYKNFNNSCLCSDSCLEPIYENKTNIYCSPKYCWSFKKNKCISKGANYIAPLVLNIIPITSIFGVGYAVIERWDLVAMQLGVIFGPCLLFCGSLCCNLWCKNKQDDGEKEVLNTDCTDICTLCFQCSYSITIIVFWIYSIVWVATPGEIHDGNGCYLSGFTN